MKPQRKTFYITLTAETPEDTMGKDVMNEVISWMESLGYAVSITVQDISNEKVAA